MRRVLRWVGVAALTAASACAGNATTLDSTAAVTTSTTIDPAALPVTYDGGEMRFDPPGDMRPARSEQQVRSGNHAKPDATVVFALYTSWNTGQMHDDGSVGPDQVRVPVWMIRTPDVVVGPDSLAGGVRGPAQPSGVTVTTGKPRPVDTLAVIGDATGSPMLSRDDDPDNPPVPWTGEAPKPQRATSCPADLSKYKTGLVNDGGTLLPTGGAIDLTQPRATLRASNGDVYALEGGEGSYDQPNSAKHAGDGVILLMHFPADPCQTSDQHWGEAVFRHEPSHSGAVTLVAVDGDSVRYRTAAATTGTYNAVTGEFSP